jgi:hypothetical protein
MSRRRQRGPDRSRPVYARALRLDYLQLSPFACVFLFEGMIALAVLLSLAELVTWWSVILLPATVAVLVKINDVVASLFGCSKMGRRLSRARGVARVKDARDEMPTVVIKHVGLRGDDSALRRSRRLGGNERRLAAATRFRPVERSES